MSDIDLSALEKALSKKGRQPKQDLSISQSLSNQELMNEVVKLAEEMENLYSRSLRTRYQGSSYAVRYGGLYCDGYPVRNINEVPRVVLERLITNGNEHLKDYHKMVYRVAQENPGLALEASLEGKTGSEVLEFAYRRRTQQIMELLQRRVSSSDASLSVKFTITIKPPLAIPFPVGISFGLHRSSVSVDGVTPHAKKPEEMARLVHFLNCFEQVESEINRQLDGIEINRR